MKELTIHDIAERRLAYIKHLQNEVKELNEAIHNMQTHFIDKQTEFKVWSSSTQVLLDENMRLRRTINGLRRIINEAASLLKAPSNDEEPKEEEQ